MSCSRNSCRNVMCDTHIPKIGYVCNDCQKEFKEFLAARCITPSNGDQIREHLEYFMETAPKNSFENEDHISVGEFFRMYTR